MSLIDILIVILLLGWVGGFSMHVAGGLIHLLLVIALVMFVVRMIGGGSGGGRRI
jgi:hypothetical protein